MRTEDFTKVLKIIAYFFVILSIVAFFVMNAYGQESGADWLDKIDKAERVDFSYGEMAQTITTSTGKERTLEIKSWTAEGGDLSLMLYTGPARVKGDKILIRDGGDNIWYYMKRRDVTRHFTGHTRRQKAMGSDFSYQDLSQGDMTEDYVAEVLGSEKIKDIDCVKLNCVPTESGPSYAKVVVWASKEDYMSRQIEYYDEKGLLKTLYISDFREVEGRSTAFLMEMVNHRENSKTIMRTVSLTYSVEPKSRMFTKSALSEKFD